MKKIEFDEMKKRLVEMLIELNDICEENDIDIFLTAGTLLGAIRHKGFIPWDDDIDVQIPRPQYNKLIDIMRERNGVSRYKLMCNELNENYLYPFAKFSDTKTLLIEKDANSGAELGLYIDIFPIDGMGCVQEKAKKHMKRIKRYIYLNTALIHVNPLKLNTSTYKKVALLCLKIISKTLGAKWIHKKINKLANNYSYDDSKFVGVAVEAPGEQKIVLKDDMYSGYENVEFEGNQFKAPKNWDLFLSKLYGNYMELPPVEKRIPKHSYELYAKEEILNNS